MESPLSFSGFFFPKRTKNDVFVLIRLKMDQKGHIIDQKGLKMYEKRQKMEFSDLKYMLFKCKQGVLQRHFTLKILACYQ